jgi:hypothetical protein
MILKAKPLAILVVSILFGGIAFTTLMGWWSTESRKIAATYAEGEFAGQANPADIRGSYTLGDIEKNFGIPAVVLAQAFAVDAADPAGFPVKELETLYAGSPVEIGTASVRLFVAFYLGLPYDLSAGAYLPQSAALILQERPLSDAQAAYLQTHTAAPATPQSSTEQEGAPATTPEAAPGPAATQHAPTGDETDTTIKGKTTFAELLAWGVSQAEIEEVLGMPAPENTTQTIRDFCNANGQSFETVKAALQALVDN